MERSKRLPKLNQHTFLMLPAVVFSLSDTEQMDRAERRFREQLNAMLSEVNGQTVAPATNPANSSPSPKPKRRPSPSKAKKAKPRRQSKAFRQK